MRKKNKLIVKIKNNKNTHLPIHVGEKPYAQLL
jgi:hypothetical protein